MTSTQWRPTSLATPRRRWAPALIGARLGLALCSIPFLLSFPGLLFTKELVSEAPNEVPPGFIDFYLTGDSWHSDIRVAELRDETLVELARLGGFSRPHSVRIPFEAGPHQFRVSYSQTRGDEFVDELQVHLGERVGRRVRIHNESAGIKKTDPVWSHVHAVLRGRGARGRTQAMGGA
jgi:hypothetical protein